MPALAKAVGSTFLERRVARLQPDVHVFGHTHFGWDATLDGTRYVQACLTYPRERRDRLTTVAAVCCPADAPDRDTCRPCPPFSGRAGAAAPPRARRVRAALPVRLVCVLRRKPAAARPDAHAAALRREAARACRASARWAGERGRSRPRARAGAKYITR